MGEADDRVLLSSMEITVTMKPDGNESVRFRYSEGVTVAYVLGILELCRDMVLHPEDDDQ